jgi:hypothetical protein
MEKPQTKAKAQKEAKKLGLKGIHKMGQGWMAGKTHKAYVNAEKRLAKKTKNG